VNLHGQVIFIIMVMVTEQEQDKYY